MRQDSYKTLSTSLPLLPSSYRGRALEPLTARLAATEAVEEAKNLRVVCGVLVLEKVRPLAEV
jgi:hypothetical protein